jgi:hypothetical protein
MSLANEYRFRASRFLHLKEDGFFLTPVAFLDSNAILIARTVADVAVLSGNTENPSLYAHWLPH